MKNVITLALTTGALAAAGLGMAGTAAAFPNDGTAEDVVSELETEGYNVQVNGLVQVPLSTCRVTDVHPTLPDSATLQDKMHTMVFVDVACPSHD
jgi:hypothetical protein